MLIPVAPDGLTREVAGLSPLSGAVHEVATVYATVGRDMPKDLLDAALNLARRVCFAPHGWGAALGTC